MDLNKNATVAVAVVSWNTRDLLDACLESLAPEAHDNRAEVWVIDNASTDGSADLVRERHPWANLIVAETNLGFGPAVNIVANRTTTPWIAPANADIRLSRGALAALIDVGERQPDAGIVAPRLRLDDGSTQHSVYPFPTVGFTLLFNLGVAQASDRLADGYALEGRWNPDRRRSVDWAIGAFLLVRRTAWQQVGGFDAQQWMYAEDLDLGWRLSRKGWKTYYEPGSVVNHRASAAVIQVWGDERERQWQRSTYAWMLRRRGLLRTRLVALLNVVGAAGWAVALTPAARLRPQRWAHRRALMRRSMSLHMIGLEPKAKLLEHR